MRDARLRHASESYPPTTSETMQAVRALASNLARGPVSIERLRSAERAVREMVGGRRWLVFESELVSALRAQPVLATSWSAALVDAALASVASSGFTILSEHAEALSAKAAARVRMRSPIDVWRDPWLRRNDIPIDDAPVADFALAIRLDPQTAVLGLEVVPTVDLICAVLDRLSDDREVLLETVVSSPQVYDETGEWLPEKALVAVLAMEVIVDHAGHLLRAVGSPPNALLAHEHDKVAIDNLRETDLRPWLETAFRVVLSRSDGQVICEGYLVKLSRVRLTESDSRSPWSATADAISVLATQLAPRSRVSSLRDAWRAEERRASARAKGEDTGESSFSRSQAQNKQDAYEGDGARTLRSDGLPWLVAAAHLLACNGFPDDQVREFVAWMRELLRGRDPSLSLAFRDGRQVSAAYDPVAMVLGRVEELEAEVRAAYTELEPQRRRGAYSLNYEDYDFCEPSLFLLRVSFCSLLHVCSRATPVHGDTMLLWLFDRARRLWLTATNDPGEHRAMTVPLAFAYVERVCGARTPAALARMVPWIQGTADQLCSATWLLWKNSGGRDAHYAAALIADAGGDPLVAVETVLGYATLTDRIQYIWPSVHELADALGVRSADSVADAREP